MKATLRYGAAIALAGAIVVGDILSARFFSALIDGVALAAILMLLAPRR
jgi:hypothetical protein